jgi:hypothetical protein
MLVPSQQPIQLRVWQSGGSLPWPPPVVGKAKLKSCHIDAISWITALQ